MCIRDRAVTSNSLRFLYGIVSLAGLSSPCSEELQVDYCIPLDFDYCFSLVSKNNNKIIKIKYRN